MRLPAGLDRHQRQAAAGRQSVRTRNAGPKKSLEREALLRRHRELQAEIAQHDRNLREGEARLPVEEQLRLNL
jgi:hypothetical protein